MRRPRALAVPVRRLSLSISSHFYALAILLCVPRSQQSQKHLKPLFLGLKSFKIIDVDTIKRRVTSARYVCVYCKRFHATQAITAEKITTA